MNFTRNTIFALAAAIGVALPATAGLKYWTTGGYDADSYVQEGLVLNYDGIRNAGLGQPHSTNATTWVNLANPGTHDLSFYVTKAASGGTLNWQDDGYLFNNGTVFREMSSSLFVPGKQTTQVLMDATSAAQGSSFGYVWFPQQVGDDNTYWSTWSVSVRGADAIWYNTHKANADGTIGTTDRPKWSGTQFTYLTAIANETYTAVFSGTTEPTGATGRYSTKSGTTFPDRTIGNWSLGGQPSNASNPLGGSIKCFRFYANKVLDSGELIWNRAVDQARFFGAAPASAIPVTNVVVASAGGNEKIGEYAVDSNGYTFTAPATRNDGGLEYALDGYTIETWNSATGTWGAPETFSGNSYAATDSGKVRLTWKWRATNGLLTRWNDAAYGVDDYVQDGLVLHFDGIRNVGADAPHDDAAVVWKNIAPGGGYDLLAHHYTGSGRAYGFAAADTNSYWTADGFHFSGAHPVCDFFFHAGTITVPATYTMQILVDANTIDQKNGGTVTYPVCFNPWNLSTVGIRRKEDDANNTHSFYLVADVMLGDIGSQRPRDSNLFCLDYGTAILDVIETENGEVGGATFFTGTTIESKDKLYRPTMWAANGWQTGVVAKATSSSGFAFGGMVGGQSGNNAQAFNGKIKSFRLYDRPLTETQLSQNRIVDEARFFGGPSVTNVEVATTFSFLQGAEDAGAYGVRGAYTFTCPETSATVRGARRAPSAGLETGFAAGFATGFAGATGAAAPAQRAAACDRRSSAAQREFFIVVVVVVVVPSWIPNRLRRDAGSGSAERVSWHQPNKKTDSRKGRHADKQAIDDVSRNGRDVRF